MVMSKSNDCHRFVLFDFLQKIRSSQTFLMVFIRYIFPEYEYDSLLQILGSENVWPDSHRDIVVVHLVVFFLGNHSSAEVDDEL